MAICDSRQFDHYRCVVALRASDLPLLTTWACFAEAMYLLGRDPNPNLQRDLWAMYENEVIEFHPHSAAEVLRMSQLMDRYRNVPMDLADASLIAAAEATGERAVFTLDGDFLIYRLADGSALDVVPQ